MELSLPSRDYLDTDVFKREIACIFSREWVAVCRAEEIPAAGDFQVVNLGADSVLIVRGKNAQLRAFYNVCRHRGAQLCAPKNAVLKPGRAVLPSSVQTNGGIRCPYHAWTYDAEGALIGAPFLTDDPEFRREDFSLYPLGCEIWGGFVFIHGSPKEAKSLVDQMTQALARIANYPLTDMRIGHRIRYEVDANWKILCENYNECYHCGPVHPELCRLVPAFRMKGGAGLDWQDGIPHREGAYTFTWSGTTQRAPFKGLSEAEKTKHKGELAYPNLWLSMACDHVTAYILHPISAHRTEVECLFLFAQEEIAKPDFDHTDASTFWEVTNQQDWAICERVQQGIASSQHKQGYYAPMEDMNLDMRRYIRERMK